MSASLVPGDLVELACGQGLAYVQVTHLHVCYPETVRVLPGLHDARPADPASLARLPGLFTVLVPLSAALAAGDLAGERIGTFPVPEAERTFPRFRVPVRAASGAVLYWWLWDGDALTEADLPDQELERLPVREVTTAPSLADRLTEAQALAGPSAKVGQP